MISANLSAIFYLISGVLFILALRGLSSETSRQGNFLIIGMVIAIAVTFLSIKLFNRTIYVFIFLLIGGAMVPLLLF